jgi:hypothetical protein
MGMEEMRETAEVAVWDKFENDSRMFEGNYFSQLF